jgi:hypothetical protein
MRLTIEDYNNALLVAKNTKKEANDKLNDFKLLYIDYKKPCCIGDVVEIMTKRDVIVIGEVASLSIFHDKQVYVSSLKILSGGVVYFSKAYTSLKIINN